MTDTGDGDTEGTGEDAIVHAQLTISPGHSSQVELADNDVYGILGQYGIDDQGTAVV